MLNYLHSVEGVDEVIADREYWAEFEHDKWKLLSFTHRNSARYGWLERGQYAKYAEITASAMRFIKGIDIDVLYQ